MNTQVKNIGYLCLYVQKFHSYGFSRVITALFIDKHCFLFEFQTFVSDLSIIGGDIKFEHLLEKLFDSKKCDICFENNINDCNHGMPDT